MDGAPVAAIMLGVAAVAIWRLFPHNRRRRKPPRTTIELIARVEMLAKERGHRPLTLAHMALTLISEPDVGRMLDERGVSDVDLYAELEALLPPPVEGPVAPLNGVVLWNDDKTPSLFVIELVRGELGIPEPRGTRLVRAIHGEDFAVVGSYPRLEAERRAAQMRDLARAAGHPLEITVAERGTTKRRSRFASWFA